jgi:pimeloyl-ACP methyl ester carboxylesterase
VGQRRRLRTSLVFLTGAFELPQSLRVMPSLLPEVSILIGDLPGNHCPAFEKPSIEAFSAAYSTAIEALNRPVILCGKSLGGTVAIGCRAQNIRAVRALDPPLRSDAMAHWWPNWRTAGVPQGVFAVDAEPLSYDGMLENLPFPVRILAAGGSEPVASVLSAEDRAHLRANPQVRLQTVMNVGHDITMGATSCIVDALLELIRADQQD